jgi:hypothetical protein
VGGFLSYEALGAFKELGIFDIIGVGNNQTSSLIMSPGRHSVAMHGGPTFLKEGKVKGSSRKGVPPLVLLRVDAIDTDSN